MLIADSIAWDLPSCSPAVPVEDVTDLVLALVIESSSYRSCFQQALHEIARLMRESAALQRRHDALRDEYRRFREAATRPAAA